jgi:hypothetical protein
VQQSGIPDGQMTAFRHCCVGESRIDPWAVRDCLGFCPSYPKMLYPLVWSQDSHLLNVPPSVIML